MPSYLIKYLLRFGLIFAVALIIGSSYPRHSITRRAWGFPFEYRFAVREPYIIPGKEDLASGVNISVLFFNIWTVFMGIVLLLFSIGTIYILIRRFISLRS